MDTAVDLKRLARSLARTQHQFMRELVECREAAGLSQEEVAERLGISQSAVSQFERYDSNPTLASVRRYALAVGAALTLAADAVGQQNERTISFTPKRRSEHDRSGELEWTKAPINV